MYKINKGFTLIELLIVVAIIAILAAIAIPNFLAAQTRAKVADVKASMRTVMLGLESYYVDESVYPPRDGCDPTWLPPGGEQWVQLYRLTTPISYCTKVPSDRFAYTNYQGYQRPFYYESDNPPKGSSSYALSWPGLDWPEDSNSAPSGAKWPGQMASTKWVLFSKGPDLKSCSEQSIWPYNQYDPTNGTLSKGDIWKLGPGNYGAR